MMPARRLMGFDPTAADAALQEKGNSQCYHES